MRVLLLLLLLLAACALPDLDIPEQERAADAEYPELVPSGEVIGRVGAMPDPDPEATSDLKERAGALRDRAKRIETPAPDVESADRAARLRERAQGLR